ncbi:MAG TPA: outer membrane beta-barrel protein [Bryobacteraceae bacterium]|nr:outer membrane beta-barrel protein [Bryobacteraceae bacterium]
MKTQFNVWIALFICGTAAMAQESPTPKVEVGLNYSFDRIMPGGGLSNYNANGGFADIEYNLTRNLGIVGDLGVNYAGTANGISVKDTTFQYLFGPRLNIRRYGRWNPFIQALFGEQRFSNGFAPGTAFGYTGASQTNFSMALGGGLDIALAHSISLRPVEVDYMPLQIPYGTLRYTQNDFRYAAGVVFRLGAK